MITAKRDRGGAGTLAGGGGVKQIRFLQFRFLLVFVWPNAEKKKRYFKKRATSLVTRLASQLVLQARGGLVCAKPQHVARRRRPGGGRLAATLLVGNGRERRRRPDCARKYTSDRTGCASRPGPCVARPARLYWRPLICDWPNVSIALEKTLVVQRHYS